MKTKLSDLIQEIVDQPLVPIVVNTYYETIDGQITCACPVTQVALKLGFERVGINKYPCGFQLLRYVAYETNTPEVLVMEFISHVTEELPIADAIADLISWGY